MSVYAGVGVSFGGGPAVKVGGYFKGVNVECYWTGYWDSYGYRDSYFVNNDLCYNYYGMNFVDFCLGYGFKINRNWLITPQIGYFDYDYYDYYDHACGQQSSYTDDYEEYAGVVVGCRAQYCFSRYVSLAIALKAGIGCILLPDFGLIFTLPFTKK